MTRVSGKLLMFVKVFLTIALPFILAWEFIATLLHEMRSAFRYAYLKAGENFQLYQRLLKATVAKSDGQGRWEFEP